VASGDADSRARARNGVVRRPEGIRRSQRERSVGTGRVTVRPCRVARAPPRPRPDKPGGGDRDAVVIRFGAGGADAAAREGGPRVPCRLPPWRRPWGLLSSSSTRAAGGLGICLARGLERPEFGRWPAGGENALHRLGQRSAVHSSTGRLCSSGNAASRTGRMEGGWMHRATAVSVSPCVCDAGPVKAIRLFGRLLLGFRVGERVPVPVPVPCVLPDGSVRRCGVRGGTRCSVPPWTADCDGTTFVPGV
jgi:hypothetical protein